MCEPMVPRLEPLNVKGIRTRNEVMKFVAFCDGKPHMQEIVREIASLYIEAKNWGEVGDNPVAFLFDEFIEATMDGNTTRAIAAKFLLRL